MSTKTIYGVLLGEYGVADARVRAEGAFDVLPANRELAGAEIELIEVDDREFCLKRALQAVADDYAFAVIDCPRLRSIC